MKQTFLFFLGIFLFLTAYSQKDGMKGVNEKTYYDVWKTKLHLDGTKYPDGTATVKEYYESGTLKLETSLIISSGLVTSAKAYDEFGKLRFSFSKNNQGNYIGEHKIYSYTSDFKSTYLKFYSIYKNGKLEKYKSLYEPNRVHEIFENLEYKEYDKNNKLITYIKYSPRDTTFEQLETVLTYDNGVRVVDIYFSKHNITKYQSKGTLNDGSINDITIAYRDSVNNKRYVYSVMDKSGTCTYKALFNYSDPIYIHVKPGLETLRDDKDFENEQKYLRPDLYALDVDKLQNTLFSNNTFIETLVEK